MIRLRFPLVRPMPVNSPGYATIALSDHQSAQGPVLRRYGDGRVVIDTGRGKLTGMPLGAARTDHPFSAGFFGGLM